MLDVIRSALLATTWCRALGVLNGRGKTGRRTGRAAGHNAVPHPRDGDYDAGFTQFVTKATDRYSHGLGKWVGIFVPGLLEKLLGTEVARGGDHQRLQYGDLLGRKLDKAAIAPHPAG